MHHLAIMNASWKLIPKIVSGEKSVESRWYRTRRAPWGAVKKGDVVYFKNAGEPVTARAVVSEVLQFEMRSIADARKIIERYGMDICLVNNRLETWGRLPRYCILMRLASPKRIAPFAIDKKGFGSAAAWLTVKHIKEIRM